MATVTILELALSRGLVESEGGGYSAEAIEATGLPFMGGCALCGACIAAYNAAPTKSGFLMCAKECADGHGFATIEEAEAFLAETPRLECDCGVVES